MASLISALAVCTALLAYHKSQIPQLDDETPAGTVHAIAYRAISGPRGCRCQLMVNTRGESQFQAFFMGAEYIRTACDSEELWFWMPTYSKEQFFFCPVWELDSVGLSPMFRPSFAACMSGLTLFDKRPTKDGLVEFEDGEYKVFRIFEEGLLEEQFYTHEGKPMVSVCILERQNVEGLSVPKSVSVNIHDGQPPFVFHMGRPEINPPDFPKIDPPYGKIRTRLDKVR